MPNNSCRHRIGKHKYLVFPRQYKNCFHRRIRALLSRNFSSGIIKHLIGQQFRPKLDLLCHEDFNVGLSFASWHHKSDVGLTAVLKVFNMNDVCRFSRDHVEECSEGTVLSCWRRFGRYFRWPDDGRSISQNVTNIKQ